LEAIILRKTRLLLGLIVLTLCFIWGNSLLPATISGGISDFVSQLLSHLFGTALSTDTGHGVVRKLAHATEFAALGAELTALWRVLRHEDPTRVALGGVGAALIDETIQLFVEGRSGQIRDVWIDLSGFAVGCLLCWVLANRSALIRHLR
jgi:VanZ family protein